MELREKEFIYYYLIKEVKSLRSFLKNVDVEGYDYRQFTLQHHIARDVYDPLVVQAKAIYAKNQTLGIDFFTINDAIYPAGLHDLSDAPIILYYIGNLAVLKKEAVAMIGSRLENEAIFKRVRHVAQLVDKRGLAVVSGLAKGIDFESHNAIVERGNNCIGIIPGPLETISPVTSRGLFKDIIKNNSIVISEYDVLMPYNVRYYNERNRIIVAIATRVIAGNIYRKDGYTHFGGTGNALNTASKLGRDIYYFDNNYEEAAYYEYLEKIKAKAM